MKEIQENKPRLLTFSEMCHWAAIKHSQGRALVFKNQIPVLRIGRLLRFDQNDLMKWIEEKKQYKF